MDASVFVSVLLTFSLSRCEHVSGQPRVCAYFSAGVRNRTEAEPGNQSVRCNRSRFCFGIWRKASDGGFHPDKQGCWPTGSKELRCGKRCTDTSLKPHALYSCCCDADLCNAAPPELLTAPHGPATPQGPYPGLWLRTLCLIAVVVVFCALALLIIYSRARDRVQCLRFDSGEAASVEDGLGNVELTEAVGQGRFGGVWRGVHRGKTVAVKVFPSANYQHFSTERAVLSLPLMDHQNVVRLLASGRRQHHSQTQYLLITEYHSQGSLHSYLTRHREGWRHSLRLAHSLTAGLSFLHTEISYKGLCKPAIAHRDLSSSNVLVRECGECVIGDFGVAQPLTGSRPGPDTYRIHTVGTFRYMAPELLDGSVNLQDCESTLKRADVYSLALLLWEILSTCTDLVQGDAVTGFQTAFEAEIGTNPSFETMVDLVSKRRQRPRLPPAWREFNKYMVETVEDCWDQDAEARLSAQRAETRINDLVAMCEHEATP